MNLTQPPDHPHLKPSAPEPFPHADPAIRLLFAKVRRLENEQHRSHHPLWAKPRLGPFTERILNYHHKKDIQPFRIAFYTGMEDPLTHIHSFQSALGCKSLIDEGMRLLFPSTLNGATLNWFYRLNPRIINSFDSRKHAFLYHFMIQTDRLYSTDDLYMLRQSEDEPLREYAAQFSHKYSCCPETDDRAAFGAFNSGLCESNFLYLVHNNPWNTYAKLMKQAAIHAKAEYFNSKRGPTTPARNTFADPSSVSVPTLVPPQHSALTPSTQHPKRKDSYQYTFINSKCGRHGNHHQPSGNNPPKTSDWAPLPFTPKPRFEVFSTEQGRLPKTQKLGWAPITFCEEEECGVILPHDDPIIIRANISNFDVWCILVDTGSSVSVMFADAFNELQIPSYLLDRSITPLVSFSCDVVQPIGSIHLSISIGAATSRATVTTPFLIIDCPIAYNVILGHPAMAQMKVFISTQMLLLKFPTSYGTGIVRGDKLDAQSYYASAVKSTN
ncbi:unnamed protein product [Prunus armeniaca]